MIILHGLNMVAKRPPYLPSKLGFTEDDARFLEANGFRAVRLGVIYKAVEPSPGVYDDDYLRQIEATVSMLARHGIYSLIDFHQDAYNERFGGEGFPDWAVLEDGPKTDYRKLDVMAVVLRASVVVDRFWLNPPGPGGVGLQERYAAALAHTARRFVGDDSVLGYDLFNEPLPAAKWLRCRQVQDCGEFDAVLGDFQSRVTTAIRRTDDRHLVWYEPNTLFNWGTPTRLPPIPDRKVGMSFHNYCSPFPVSCQKTIQDVFTNAEQRTVQTNDALLLTEFGHPEARVLADFANGADQHRMSWLEWAYCGCGNPTYPYPTTDRPEALVLDLKKPPSDKNVDQAKLQVLVRPHPQVVAGTPEAFRFDTTTKTFAFSYDTARASGRGRFAPGSCTEIFVPQLHYRNGYRVSTNGARVVSSAGAGILKVRSLPNARRIVVRVTPDSNGKTDLPRTGGGC